jgi:hypothetical protein
MLRMGKSTDDQYPDKIATKRMEDALRALTTPHKQNKELVGQRVKTAKEKLSRAKGASRKAAKTA